MWCARVLMTVTIKYEHPSGDLRMLDGSSLSTHLWLVRGMLALGGASCTQKQLMLSVRCVAKMILHTAPRLTKVCARRGAGLINCHRIAGE